MTSSNKDDRGSKKCQNHNMRTLPYYIIATHISRYTYYLPYGLNFITGLLSQVPNQNIFEPLKSFEN